MGINPYAALKLMRLLFSAIGPLCMISGKIALMPQEIITTAGFSLVTSGRKRLE
jgi:hypothetical protein